MKNEFMKIAIKEAEKAALLGEVPVGAAVFYKNKLIASAHNLTETLSDPTAHAEILAIKKACELLGNWRLNGTSLFVTLEPCPMCAGAIVNSRIERVVFGAYDEKAGAFGTMLNLTEYPLFKPTVEGGVLRDECASMLTEFFKKKRVK